jgi:RNA polymerase sigma-70 factor, ECF subfamily
VFENDNFIESKLTVTTKKEQQSDEDLLRAIALGDEESLAFLYDRYKTILFSIIFRILNNRAEAEDILQDTFFQVWQKAGNFDESRGRGFTWLVTLARSRAIDRVRSLVSQQRIADESSSVEMVDRITDLEDKTVQKHQREAVQNVMKELPEEQRKVLHLAYFEDLSQTEIAERLDEPLGTIKTRMRNGMIRLRDKFSDRLKEIL